MTTRKWEKIVAVTTECFYVFAAEFKDLSASRIRQGAVVGFGRYI